MQKRTDLTFRLAGLDMFLLNERTTEAHRGCLPVYVGPEPERQVKITERYLVATCAFCGLYGQRPPNAELATRIYFNGKRNADAPMIDYSTLDQLSDEELDSLEINDEQYDTLLNWNLVEVPTHTPTGLPLSEVVRVTYPIYQMPVETLTTATDVSDIAAICADNRVRRLYGLHTTHLYEMPNKETKLTADRRWAQFPLVASVRVTKGSITGYVYPDALGYLYFKAIPALENYDSLPHSQHGEAMVITLRNTWMAYHPNGTVIDYAPTLPVATDNEAEENS